MVWVSDRLYILKASSQTVRYKCEILWFGCMQKCCIIREQSTWMKKKQQNIWIS